ncbi:hypothetical protein PPERSA_01531 [Pseudocohnilembus persalinus]|uniref:Uncharacterized protein n=1 Tax=Pseudocohnilembus persalinus TaxID=266149 RepID=A0A0V0R7R5_PSEPJ|nr:hypothetical protein PPERSA_01531 [Pseudocohnilembus persalinus]|eukprot:KRX10519.1 hypothetical protein PPERSA_01531 [Pseudocohnilembus persalinus]
MSKNSIDLSDTNNISNASFLESSKDSQMDNIKKANKEDQGGQQKKNKKNQKQKGNASNQQNNQKGNKRKPQGNIDQYDKLQKKTQNSAHNQIVNTIQAAQIFLYYPGEQYPDLSEHVQNHSYIEIRIASQYINKFNKSVIKRYLWGNDSYTSESDAVCMLIHQGIVKFYDEDSDYFLKEYAGISLYCKVSKAKRNYNGSLKYGFLSRSQKNYAGYAIKPETHQWIKSLGSQEELTMYAKKMATWEHSKREKCKVPKINTKYLQTIPEVNIVFNLNNEPAYKYSCMNICDKWNDSKNYKSYRLQTQVLYLDTRDNQRFEISANKEESSQNENEKNEQDKDAQNDNEQQIDKEENLNDHEIQLNQNSYKIAKVLNPFEIDNQYMNENKIPLVNEQKEVIFDDIEWTNILWGTDIITIKDFQIKNVTSFKFYMRSDVDSEEQKYFYQQQ